MYLSRLEIFGFKSFAKKTEVRFHDGMTAIVGPNGCGKSNIVDAIRWVLGEQKAGTLRSENMQNVIFNGTRAQKPLGMAEVSLTIQNTKNILPIEYSEVVLTRRLFRSGESQYLINNSVCRLKDIIDLFMDTGMGANAYSVIELSMVEKILNGKPEERRQIFEEAAGVTKYKLRRKAAFRKLEATEQDLTRLSDIISEVEKTTASLRRQVNKAQRYRNYSDELRALELDYSAWFLAKNKAEAGPLAETRKKLMIERAEISSKLGTREAEIEEKQREILEIEKQLTSQQQTLLALSRKIQEKEEEILVSQERVTASENARHRAKKEIESLQVREKDLQQEKKGLRDDLSDAEETLNQLNTELAAAQQELQDFQETYQKKRSEGEVFEDARLKRMEDVGEVKKEEERLRTQIAYFSQQVLNIEEEQRKLEAEIARAKETSTELSAQKDTLQATVADLEEAVSASTRDLDELTEEINKTKSAIVELKGQISARRERLALLRSLLDNYEDYPESVRHLLQKNDGPAAVHGTVGDMIAVDARYRPAIEAALADMAVAVIVDGLDQAQGVFDELRAAGKGSVTVMPKEWDGTGGSSAVTEKLLTLPGVLGKAVDFVRGDDSLKPVFSRLLADTLVVDTLATAREIISRAGQQHLAVVTLDGEVAWSWGGIRAGGRGDAESSILGRKAQADELEQEIAGLEEKLAESEDKHQRLQHRVRELQEKAEADQRRLQEKRKLLQDVEVALGKAQVEQKRSQEQQEELKKEKLAIEEDYAAAENALADLSPSLSAFESQKEELDSKYKAWREELQALESRLREKQEAARDLHLKVVAKQGEIKSIRNTLERLETTEQEIAAAQRQREEEIIAATHRVEELGERIDELRSLLQEDFAERKELEEVIARIESEYRTRKEAVDEIDKSLKGVRQRRDELSEQLHKTELRLSELSMNRSNLIEHIRESYEFELESHTPPEELDEEATSKRINELKQRLRSMGPVNMLALKDYEVEKERLDFLLSQRDDLLNAEANLKETIKVINRTAHERFNSVFSKIRENFIQVFKSFFENVLADLRLDSDDPLEAEVIIEASPKGRRLGSLALLSGGEKTLTAISLLFAIYLVKPSPFCILDEVDAPLDDANIGRFTGAIKKFSDNTQFIVVTHNKLTMSAAHQLYGITMEEPGVSKIVSVKFDEIENGKNDNTAVATQE